MISFSVENVLNLYGLVVLTIISILCCYAVVSHYADIQDGAYNQTAREQDIFPLIVPTEFFVLYLLMTVCTILPFAKSPPLRYVYDKIK